MVEKKVELRAVRTGESQAVMTAEWMAVLKAVLSVLRMVERMVSQKAVMMVA